MGYKEKTLSKNGFAMKTRLSSVLLLLFCGCAHWQASRLQYGDFVTRGNGLVEVQADSTDAFYPGGL